MPREGTPRARSRPLRLRRAHPGGASRFGSLTDRRMLSTDVSVKPVPLSRPDLSADSGSSSSSSAAFRPGARGRLSTDG